MRIYLCFKLFISAAGRGLFGSADDEDVHRMEIQTGDIYTLESGSIFYVQSIEDPTREKLRIYALFTKRISENSQV